MSGRNNMEYPLNAMAVTGMGCMAGGGSSVGQLWANLQRGVVNCQPVPAYLFRTILDYPVFSAPAAALNDAARAFIREISPGFAEKSVSRTVLLACSAVVEALLQAGITPALLASCRVGIVMGTTVGCTFHNEEYYSAWRAGLAPDLAPVRFYLGGNVSSALHRILKTKGPSAVVTNACASGTDAVGVARNWLLNGQCDVAIAGGADELSRVAYNGFASLMLADTSPCRPFSIDRQGLNLGEGAGALVLERETAANTRGAGIIGRVRGYGCAADAYHPTAPHPEGRGLKAALRQALRDAGDLKGLPALINAHGTGTKANDKAETSALADIFPVNEKLPVVSTKGITGHTLGAAGAIEAVLTIKALRDGYTVGTVGCLAPDPEFALRPLSQKEKRHLEGRWGISQSLAFGGGNSVLVLEAAE